MVKPAVRLDGFAGEWEEILLGEHCSFSKGSGFSKSDISRDGMPLLLYGTLYTDYRSEIHHVAHKAEPKSDMVVSKGNEVVVPASGETPDDIARASAIREPGIILGGDLNIVRPGPRIDPSFLALAISNGVTQRELASKAQGKSVVHLRNPDLREQSAFVPTIGEQKAIAEYARNLDAAITQSEVRLEKLRQYKQTMLHKMFPSGTCRVPEIRFEGFEGEWTQIEFERVVKRVTAFSTDTRLPRIEFEDIISGSGRLNKDPKTKISAKQGIAFTAGDVLFGKLRPYLKNWIKPEFDGVAVGDFWVLRSAGVDANFLYSLIQTESFQDVANITAGSKMPRSSWEVVSTTLFAIPPTTQEQARVGMFFEALDLAINAEEEKLLKFKNLKVTFLAKMLV